MGRVTLRRGHVAKLKQCRLRERGKRLEGGRHAVRSVLGKGYSGLVQEGAEAGGMWAAGRVQTSKQVASILVFESGFFFRTSLSD